MLCLYVNDRLFYYSEISFMRLHPPNDLEMPPIGFEPETSRLHRAVPTTVQCKHRSCGDQQNLKQEKKSTLDAVFSMI